MSLEKQPLWFVYILRCADNSLYTGVTTDIARRLNEHNHCNKRGARYTRCRRPLILAYQETCISRANACQREWEIKQLSKKQKEQLLSASYSRCSVRPN